MKRPNWILALVTCGQMVAAIHESGQEITVCHALFYNVAFVKRTFKILCLYATKVNQNNFVMVS